MSDPWFARSLWAATAPAAPPAPPFAGEATTDVAIVGAGNLGLSAALHLAERGVAATVLEAAEPGFGASGRNTGFVVPNFVTPLGPERVVAALGQARGEALCRMLGGAASLVFALIARHGIAAEARRTGWLQPAHAESWAPFIERRARAWQRLGQPVRLLDRDATVRATGSPFYRAALFDPTGGHINPLAYVRGLAAAAVTAGAQVHAASPVLAITREGARWRLSLAHGSLAADRVFLATNALVGQLAPDLARAQVPILIHQVATRPLAPEWRDRVLPDDSVLSDTRRNILAYRWTARGQLVTGGIAVVDGPPERLARLYLRRLRRQMPDLPPLEAAHLWRGTAGVTPDLLPKLIELGPGLVAALGCNGRGIAMTTALGCVLAELAAGAREADLPLPIERARPVPWHGAVRHAKKVLLPLARLKDAVEERRVV